MRIIDFHTHIYPPKIASKAAENICNFYELPNGGMDGTAQTLMERGDTAGISEFVLLPVAIKPDHTRSINNFVLEEVKENSRFYAFGTIHAEMDNILEEVEYIARNGLLGIKMHPDTQRFNIDDDRLFPVYDMIGDKIPVLFHTGDKHFDYSHPARLRKVIDMFPKLQVIAAHFGGWSMFDTAYKCLKDTNCMMDISSSISFMEKGQPEKLIKAYGADRLLFGSDYPVWDPAKEVEKFLQLNIKDEDKEKIAYKNALKLLKRY